MVELSPELVLWLAIFGTVTPIIAATLTALLTHLGARRREDYAKKMKIVGWLEWLKNFLKQVDHFHNKEQKIYKLPWWADHAMQNIGDSLHLLRENTRRNLLNLVNECWLDDPILAYTHEEGKIVDASYDKQKVQNMKSNIEKLIKQIKDS